MNITLLELPALQTGVITANTGSSDALPLNLARVHRLHRHPAGQLSASFRRVVHFR